MKKEEIIEGNKLIAEFMGGEFNERQSFVYFKLPVNKAYSVLDDLKYHSSWDWLMPVVEKIEKGNFGVKQCRKVVEIYIDDTKENIIHSKHRNRIESLWYAIIEFINWYNKNKDK